MHGDYRIDNTMLDATDATKVRAVLDWEMSTLGDPLSDAALMCVYRHPTFDMVHPDAAWASPQIPSADDLAQKYSVASGQPLDHWEFYMGLAYFKLAIIAAGIQFRDRMGRARDRVRRQGRLGGRPVHRDGPDRPLLARPVPYWGLIGRKWGTTGPNPRPGARTLTNGKAVTMPSETLRGRDASDATDETILEDRAQA